MSENRAWTAGQIWISALVQNDTRAAGTSWYGNRDTALTTATYYLVSQGSHTVTLAANDTLRIKMYNGAGIAINTYGAPYNHFSVNRVR